MHDDSFLSLLKTAILKEVKGYLPVHEKASIITEGVKANTFTLKSLLLEWEWFNEKPKEIHLLSDAVKLAVKHKDNDYDLIINVLIQALKRGYEYILAQSTPESKRFCSLVRDVRNELYRARLYTKFLNKGRYYIGLFNFEHNTVELALEHFNKRFDKKVVIGSKGAYYTYNKGLLVQFQPLIAK